MSGRQSVVDRMTAARHTITGSDLPKSVCKATTEEMMGPKKKHLDYLLQCTNAEHINIPDLADNINQRSTNSNWVVVFKTLITTHHLMIYGHERFMWCLATRASVFSLDDFTDRTNVQGYDMSTYIRRYAKYINAKALAFRTMAFDFCRVKRGKDEGVLRTMCAEKLLKTLPSLQDLMDALLDFEVSSNNLSNGVINSAFMLLFKDSIRLFACYNDGIINLLEKYFDMTKKDCRNALDIYKKFLIRMERIGEFLKVAEQVGIDKGEIPDLAKAPSSLLEALEQHLTSIESSKKSNWNKANTVQTVVNAFSSSLAAVDLNEKKKAVEEEKARLAAIKEQRFKESEFITATQAPVAQTTPPAPAPVAAATSPPNPFAPAVTISTSAQDLFPSPTVNNNQPPNKLSQDLIGLNTGPMTAIIQAQMAQQTMTTAPPVSWGSPNDTGVNVASNQPQPVSPAVATAADTGVNVASNQPQPVPAAMIASPGFRNNNDIGANFDTAFANSGPPPAQQTNAAGLGDILLPMNKAHSQPTQSEVMAANGGNDLDSTLVKLATNLDIKGVVSPKKTEHQWTKNQPSVRTGGAGWSPQKMTIVNTASPTWGGAAPVGGYMGGQAADWRAQSFSGQFAGQPGMIAGQPGMMGMGMRPMGVAPMGMYGQPGVGQPMYAQPPRPPAQTQAPADPFGSL